MFLVVFVVLLSVDNQKQASWSQYCNQASFTLIYGLWGICWCGVTLLLVAEYKRGMCEKWWCECIFFIGNILVGVTNLLQQIVAISDNPIHFPRWTIIEWSWSIFVNSTLVFLFFKTKQRTRNNLRPVEYINIYDSINIDSSPKSGRNPWKSTNLDL